MSQPRTNPEADLLYERDFYAWTQRQAEKLRSRSHNDIDWETVAEEIESLGRSDRREIGNRIGVILLHLLKWEFQPGQRKPGWLITLTEQRSQVEKLLKESPSLFSLPDLSIQDEYPSARRKASAETEPAQSTFPEECPYSRGDVLSFDFLPGAPWSREEVYRDWVTP